jgi:hypothetical protein
VPVSTINATTTGVITTAGNEPGLTLQHAGVTVVEFRSDGQPVLPAVFLENNNTITSSYTIETAKNAMTAGPITVVDGAIVTVPNGSSWTIV